MNRLGVIKISHEMVDSLELLTPWKSLNFEEVYSILQKSPFRIESFVFLSTCNRVEIIYKIQDPEKHLYFYEYLIKNLPKINIQPEIITGRPVAMHLLKLATGLESMVIGETEIRHQLKEAVKISSEYQCLDSTMNQFFQNIFRESKKIRKELPSNIPLSIASLGIRNLEDSLGGFASQNGYTVVIGAGKISKTSIEYLRKWDGKNIIWVNRTLDKILDEAKDLGIIPLSLEEFYNQEDFQKKYKQPINAIITATSSKKPILNKNHIQSMNFKHLVLLDLSFPPNINDDVKEIPNIKKIDLQIIKEQLEANKKRREEAAKNAYTILQDSLYKIESNWITAIATPIIREIQEKVHYHSRKRLELLFEGSLKHLKSKDKRILYDWAIRFHKDMNRIHKVGIENILKHYLSQKKD